MEDNKNGKEHGKQAEADYKKIIKLMEKHMGDDFFKSGHLHNSIANVVESYASLRVSEAVEAKEKVIQEIKRQMWYSRETADDTWDAIDQILKNAGYEYEPED